MEEVVKFLLDHLIWPAFGFLTHLYLKLNDVQKDLAVLEAKHTSKETSRDRELHELKNLFQQAFTKLDSIEEFLRRGNSPK